MQYRNVEVGHGAAGQRPTAFYEGMSAALRSGLGELFDRVDVLAGRRLVFVTDVRRQAGGGWIIDRYLLVGETARRTEPLRLPEAEVARLPQTDRVYVEGQRDPAVSVPFPTLRSLYPLVHHDLDAARSYFLNSRRGRRQVEYLCYNTGEVLKQEALGDGRWELLSHVLGQSVDGAAADVWAARSLAEEPSGAVPATGAARVVGEFELLSRLGQGGMGVVYRAWQPSLGRQVALKCMLRSGDPKGEARFSREIRALGRVEHPNLVKVFTSGAEGDQWFYVMELIDGAELASVCEQLAGSSAAELDDTRWQQALTTACEQARSRETPLSEGQPHAEAASSAPRPARVAPAPTGRGYVERAVEIVRQVAEAAHALHEAGVVHRDIKPGNIMLTPAEAHPVLMDLGLAQLADETDGRLTRTRQFVGTLRYASPEQVLAAGKVDRRTDVYSLGATLWELLTLRPMFGAGEDTPTPDLMLRIQSTDPDSPRKHNRHVPRDLEAVVLKCLEKDRARRYGTAAELAEDLGRFLRGEPVSAQPPSLHYLLGKYVRRHRLGLGTAAGILLLTMLGVVLAFVRIRAERNDAIEAGQRELREREKAEKALDDLTRSRRESEVVWKVVEEAYASVKAEDLRHVAGLMPPTRGWPTSVCKVCNNSWP